MLKVKNHLGIEKEPCGARKTIVERAMHIIFAATQAMRRDRPREYSPVGSMKLDQLVANLDLVPVEYLLKTTFGWTRARIEHASTSYRGFLQVIRNGTISHCVPSIDVDRAWESHVLCSEKYFVDCQLLFGEYLHHWPFSGRFSADDAARQLEIYKASQLALDAIRADEPHSVL